MMTGLEFSEDLKNNQINSWPEHNPMALDKTMLRVWNKRVVEPGHRDIHQNQDLTKKPNQFEACRLST